LAKNYELLEHTADTGIRVKASDPEGIFRNAALAVFDIIAEALPGQKATKPQKFHIKLKSENLEELFVNWLNELISLSAAKGLIFSGFKKIKLDGSGLEADITGNNVSGYKVNAEIKAATYHELKLEKSDSGWIAEVIFDV